MGLELLWAVAIAIALVAAIAALVKSYQVDAEAQGAIDLETNTRANQVTHLQLDLKAAEGVSDSQTKRLNDHYSAIQGLRTESRRQQKELRELTRTVEALSASHARQSASIGEIIKSLLGLKPRKEVKK